VRRIRTSTSRWSTTSTAISHRLTSCRRSRLACSSATAPVRLREADHIVPLIAGGENRESNLRTLLAAHHKTKTAADVAERKR
jgi:5-methylcytosine-specific restriction endonuclease McrA